MDQGTPCVQRRPLGTAYVHGEGIPSPELLQAWLLAGEKDEGGAGAAKGRGVTAVLTVYLSKALTYWGEPHVSTSTAKEEMVVEG